MRELLKQLSFTWNISRTGLARTKSRVPQKDIKKQLFKGMWQQS